MVFLLLFWLPFWFWVKVLECDRGYLYSIVYQRQPTNPDGFKLKSVRVYLVYKRELVGIYLKLLEQVGTTQIK